MNINIMKKLKCGLLILSTITASSISYGEESDYLSTTNIQISYAKDADNDFIIDSLLLSIWLYYGFCYNLLSLIRCKLPKGLR